MMIKRLTLLTGVVLLAVSCTDDPAPTEPTAVPEPALATAATPLTFDQISAGAFHTCGVTTDNRLYCWGTNGAGQLGDGTSTNRLTPVPVAPELRFRRVSTGDSGTCAVTTRTKPTAGATMASAISVTARTLTGSRRRRLRVGTSSGWWNPMKPTPAPWLSPTTGPTAGGPINGATGECEHGLTRRQSRSPAHFASAT